MFVNDNYGSRWVKSIQIWLREKTIKGCLYQKLILDGVMEGGLRKSKVVELVNEYLDLGLIYMDDKTVKWTSPDIKPDIKVSPLKKEVAKKQKKGYIITPREGYKIYLNDNKKEGVESKGFQDWFNGLTDEEKKIYITEETEK